MNRIALSALVLLSPWSSLRGEDKPTSLRQQYDALVKEYLQARQNCNNALDDAKTNEEQQKAREQYQAKRRRIAAELLALAEKYPEDPVAIDALSKLFTLGGWDQEQKKAADLLRRDYLQSDKIAPICQSLARFVSDDTEALLRTILAKNPNKNIRAEASFARAQILDALLSIRRGVPEEIRTYNVKELESETAKTWNEFAEKYSADIPEERLSHACAQLKYRGGSEVETAMRTLKKDKRRTIRGSAFLVLGSLLKRRADELADQDAQAAAKLHDESAENLSRAADEYGDVKMAGFVVGDLAKRELYELRHLSIGIKAPEIGGEDQDGKQFKLSDYKGKVVLLDFWSEY